MEKLKYIQKFYGGNQCRPPVCDKCDLSRAIGTWQKPDGYSLDLCTTCAKELGAEVIEGIAYVPTNLIADGWRKGANGKPEKIEGWKPSPWQTK
jgi:hypothetical protein